MIWWVLEGRCKATPGGYGKVDVRLPEKGNSNSHRARPVHLIITMMKWIRTSRLSIKNSLSGGYGLLLRVSGFGFGVSGLGFTVQDLGFRF